MKKELIDDLHTRYQMVFRKKIVPSIGNGWYNILNDVCNIIERHIKLLPEELQNQIYFDQVKEKFGQLRIYLSHDTPYMQGVLDLAETHSRFICELCGNKGSMRNFFGWYRCLCNEDLDKETEARSEKNK